MLGGGISRLRVRPAASIMSGRWTGAKHEVTASNATGKPKPDQLNARPASTAQREGERISRWSASFRPPPPTSTLRVCVRGSSRQDTAPTSL
eukprot:1159098-Pelagomonas_calceolata.AAC.12